MENKEYQSFFIQVRMMIPNLPIRNINIPKTGGKKATFKPAAIISADTLPTDSMESKAPINPMI